MPVSGFELLIRAVTQPDGALRGRAAGTLVNCAGYGPDNRLAMLEAGCFSAAVAQLVGDRHSVIGAPRNAHPELQYRVQVAEVT